MGDVVVGSSADYSDLAGGRVIQGLPGRPAFPVRLGLEVFDRCMALWGRRSSERRAVLYDPCCGGGYLLTVLGFLRAGALRALIGSDIDPDAVGLAARNLALLSRAGLDRRIEALAALHTAYGKASHAEAIAGARRLRERLAVDGADVERVVFQADAIDGAQIVGRLGEHAVDLVITDLPLGRQSRWDAGGDEAGGGSPVWRLLEALRPVLRPGAVVAVAADLRQRVAHDRYARLGRLAHGRRRVVIVGQPPS